MSSQGQLEPHRLSQPQVLCSMTFLVITLQIKPTAPQGSDLPPAQVPKMDPQFLAPQIHLWVADTRPEAHPESWFREVRLKGAGTEGARGASGGSAGSLGLLGTKHTAGGWRTPCTPSRVTSSDQAHQRAEVHH